MKGKKDMNEFDDINVNGAASPEAAEGDIADSREEQKKNIPSGVVFNEDGTYHGKAECNEEPVNSSSVNGSEARSASDYSYEKAASEESKAKTEKDAPYYENEEKKGSYPYTESREYPYASYNRNPYSENRMNREQNNPYSNPYANQGNYGRNEPRYERSDYNRGYAYPNENNNGNKKKNGTKVFAVIASVLCVFLFVALIAVVAGDKKPSVSPEENTTGSISENVPEFETSASAEAGNVSNNGEMTPKSIFQKVLPSSVGILVYDKSKTLASEGTGVLFSESTDGVYTYIVTCAHVINGSSGVITVQLFDSSKYEAEIVGYDTRTDIGVLRIKASGLKLAEVGDSTKISVGDSIYAIGNPGGVEFANSFTDGMVSALDRPVNSSETGYTTECIQHTAAINPGNSGGALVNSFGQVIGINSMKIVADDYEGMGFSVPSSVFVDIVNEILKNGYVSNRPKLGITYVAASEYSTYGMFVAIKGLPSGSIVIYSISDDSSFAGTDVKEGDMIVAVNGKGLESPSYLSEVIEEASVGDKLILSLVRIYDDYSFDEFDVTVTLVEDRGDTMIVEEETTSSGAYPGGSYDDYFNQYFEDFFGNYFGGGYPGR